MKIENTYKSLSCLFSPLLRLALPLLSLCHLFEFIFTFFLRAKKRISFHYLFCDVNKCKFFFWIFKWIVDKLSSYKTHLVMQHLYFSQLREFNFHEMTPKYTEQKKTNTRITFIVYSTCRASLINFAMTKIYRSWIASFSCSVLLNISKSDCHKHFYQFNSMYSFRSVFIHRFDFCHSLFLLDCFKLSLRADEQVKKKQHKAWICHLKIDTFQIAGLRSIEKNEDKW